MLTYHAIDSARREEWLELLNSEQVRKHLLQHPIFTAETLASWLSSKIDEDQTPGCRLRAICSNGALAGWCGIQRESGDFELALVLSAGYWGHGRRVVRRILEWGRELGHTHLLAYLPRSRPQTKALARLFGQPIGARSIQDTDFDSYFIKL
jgi:hypothetical protein